jgi:hypothetical protein
VRLVLERGMDGDDRRAIVLAHPDWHAGIVGIVCSRLVDRFARPTILFQQFDGHCKGSGRSIRGFSLLDAILTCGEPTLKAGGHDHAAGITVSSERVDAFAEAFIAHASRLLTPDDLIASIALDTVASIDELTLDVLRQCEHFGPFGRATRGRRCCSRTSSSPRRRARWQGWEALAPLLASHERRQVPQGEVVERPRACRARAAGEPRRRRRRTEDRSISRR